MFKIAATMFLYRFGMVKRKKNLYFANPEKIKPKYSQIKIFPKSKVKRVNFSVVYYKKKYLYMFFLLFISFQNTPQ